MTPYELMIKTNHRLIKGVEFTESQKEDIVYRFLSAKSDERTKHSFYQGVKCPGNTDGRGRHMYPVFYIPPYNHGKKLNTIYGQTPKTHIFSANMYELEIIRLLYVLSPGNSEVRKMVQTTLERLKTTCFGNENDGVGECFDTSLVVLRFLAAAAPEDMGWIQSRMENYTVHAAEKKRAWYSLWYFWLCLSEIPFELAKPEIFRYKDQMLPWLTTKSAVMNSEQDKTIHPVIICSLRNCLCRFPEYVHIRHIQPYVNEKDGRLYFNMPGSSQIQVGFLFETPAKTIGS